MYKKYGKRIMDIVVSLLLILTLSPLLAFLALLVRLTSKGSILFRQKRISHKGREFVCYKFRSMKENERRPEITPESQDDHTSIGTFLREWYLDELPQLFNVLKGDISLIGPRAWPVENCEDLEHKIPELHERHQSKAGIVSFARIRSGKRSKGLEDYRAEISTDIEYAQKVSLLLDMRIAFGLLMLLCNVRGE